MWSGINLRISIHALLAESDLICGGWWQCGWIFLSTLSLRRATYGDDGCHDLPRDFYPRSPCGERPWYNAQKDQQKYFYPRSPCGERPCARCIWRMCGNISIHALLAESDGHRASRDRYKNYFYPRSPCGERPTVAGYDPEKYLFLSTLSLRRATLTRPISGASGRRFLSTLSLRRATESIGTLRTVSVNFYPRSPCGERPCFSPC